MVRRPLRLCDQTLFIQRRRDRNFSNHGNRRRGTSDMRKIGVLRTLLGPRMVTDLDACLRSAGPETAAAATLRMVDERSSSPVPDWPYSGAGVCDLDPLIAEDVATATGEFTVSPIRASPSRSSGSIRGQPLHPVVDQAILCRANTLVEAGLVLPLWLQRAARFGAQSTSDAVPAACLEVLAAINDSGQVWLRDVLDWEDREEWTPRDKDCVLEAMRAIAHWQFGLLAFNDEQTDALTPGHRRLARLSAGNRLTFVDIAFFARSERVAVVDVWALASKLKSYGVIVPDADGLPAGLELTKTQEDVLAAYYAHTPVLRQPRSLEDILRNHWSWGQIAGLSEADARSALAPLQPWLTLPTEGLPPPPDDRPPRRPLRELEPLLLSRDLNGKAPYLTSLSPSSSDCGRREIRFRQTPRIRCDRPVSRRCWDQHRGAVELQRCHAWMERYRNRFALDNSTREKSPKSRIRKNMRKTPIL